MSSAGTRIRIQLPRGLVLFVLLKIIDALVPLPPNDFARGTEAVTHSGLDFGGPAIVGLSTSCCPLDRRLCVAIFRWLCPCQNRVDINGLHFAASPNLLASLPFRFTPPAESRSGRRSSGRARPPSRRN